MSNYSTVLEIVNKVMLRLHLSEVSALTDNKFAELVLDALNETMYDISNEARGIDRRGESTITLSGRTVLVSASAEISSIENVYVGQRGLTVKKPHEITKRFQQSSSTTTPVEYAVTDTSAGVIELTVWGTPSSSTDMVVSYYKEPIQYTTSDGSETPPYEAGTLIAGTYAIMLLRESGGEQTPEFQAEYAMYKKRRDKLVRKYLSDTGTSLQITY